MTSRQHTTKRSTDFGAKRRSRRMLNPHVQGKLCLPDASSSYSDICTYWAANPAFEPQRVLLRRLYYINKFKTKYVSVGLYPARDYQPWWNSVPYRRVGKSPSFSQKRRSTRWRRVYTVYMILFAKGMRNQSSDAKSVTFGSIRRGVAAG